MIALIQRVTHASVSVDNEIIGRIDQGLLALIGVEKNDTTNTANRLVERLLGYRVFADNDDKMNLSVKDIKADLLLVPQFTLAADTTKGTRPSFSSAASPQDATTLFDYFVEQSRNKYEGRVETGCFGADMQVALTNNGPVTFWLQVRP